MHKTKLVEFSTDNSGFALLCLDDILYVKSCPNGTHLSIKLRSGDVITVANTENNRKHLVERKNTPKP